MNSQAELDAILDAEIMSAVDTFEAQARAVVNKPLSRRSILNLSAGAAGGLMLGFVMSGSRQANAATATASPDKSQLNAFISIKPDGRITIMAKNPEIGQGVKTSLPMIIAEELDASWVDVDVVQSPINDKLYGMQWAGGSQSVPTNWALLRKAGATGRAMLVEAAARQWKVAASECTTADSTVFHAASNRSAKYAELASAAAKLPVPAEASLKLKDRSQFKLIGQRIGGVDNEAIVTGKPLFGIDVVLPGMLYAVYEKCPAVGGRPVSFNEAEIKAMPGVKDAFIVEGNGNLTQLQHGVAIVADTTWAAFQAKRKLHVQWDETEASKDSWTDFTAQARELHKQPKGKDVIYTSEGIDEAMNGAVKRVKSFYSYPFISHATLEPQNCTAWRQGDKIEFWAPTQIPGPNPGGLSGWPYLTKDLKLAPENITVNQTRIGGGFGRRLNNDYMCEVAAIASRVNAPVKLTWTREDDMRHDMYRSGGFHSLEGGLDANGKLVAFRDHFITFTGNGKSGVMGGAMNGSEFPVPVVAKSEVTQTLIPLKIPCGPMRAPGSNVFSFALNSFLGELSAAAKRDHVEFLLEILGEPRWLKEGSYGALHTRRAADVIKLAAEKSGWGRKDLPAGRALGIAFYFCHQGHVAEVAEVSMEGDKIIIHKVTFAADVGPIVNRSGAEQQAEGAIMDGISTAMNLKLAIENGRVQQGNFDQYNILRIKDAPPVVESHFINSEFEPTGLGEPTYAPVAPAIANAVFNLTGRRIRSLPFVDALKEKTSV